MGYDPYWHLFDRRFPLPSGARRKHSRVFQDVPGMQAAHDAERERIEREAARRAALKEALERLRRR